VGGGWGVKGLKTSGNYSVIRVQGILKLNLNYIFETLKNAFTNIKTKKKLNMNYYYSLVKNKFSARL